MDRDPLLFLEDVLESIRQIESYTAALSAESFLEDTLVQDAVLRRLEIIGEAVKRLPVEIRDRYPTVPWRTYAITEGTMTSSSLHGIWKHEMGDRGSSAVIIQTICSDGTYETRMVFSLGGGCEQHIHHHGTIEIGDVMLKLNMESGETRTTGCEDRSRNFDTRDLTAAEIDEARNLLAEKIPYSIEGDSLTMTVTGPAGEMEVVYKRQRS